MSNGSKAAPPLHGPSAGPAGPRRMIGELPVRRWTSGRVGSGFGFFASAVLKNTAVNTTTNDSNCRRGYRVMEIWNLHTVGGRWLGDAGPAVNRGEPGCSLQACPSGGLTVNAKASPVGNWRPPPR